MVDLDAETVFLPVPPVAAIALPLIPLERIVHYVQLGCKHIARNFLKS